MKISELRDAYYKASEKTSEIVRQLNFAGIAIFWIFRAGKDTGGIIYSPEILRPLCLFVASLTFDLLQFIYKTLIWGHLNSHYWKIHHNDATDVKILKYWNWPTITFFWAKVFTSLVAYFWLFKFFWQQI